MIIINAYELKEYIIENNKVVDILENIGCHSVTSYAKEYRAALPNKTNKTAVSIRKENLSGRIYTPDENISGDIISIVMEITELKFKDALKKIHDILGLKFTLTTTPKRASYDPLDIFKNVKSYRRYKKQELEILPESVLDNHNFLKLPHINLIREGIIPCVQREFDVMYDMESQRILFPHRHWSTGELLGIFGRTTVKQWKILGIPKYLGIIPYPKSLNLYGLHENYKGIQDAGYVVLVEGEKSTLKAKSLGYNNFVALGGHELSQEQVRILISLNVDIVLALDKDVPEQESIDMCNQFKGIRNAYYLYDKYDILDEKDAPIDKGIKIFNYLLKYKKKVS